MRILSALSVMAALLTLPQPLGAQSIDIDTVGLPLDRTFPVNELAPYSATHAFIMPQAVVDEDDTSALLGKGYDVFKGEILPQHPCIVADAGVPDGPPPSKGDPIVESDYFFNNIVTSERSLANSSKSDVSFGFTYKLISIGFENENSSSSEFNSIDSFGRFYRRFQMLRQYRDGGHWSDAARDLLAARNIKDFLTLCGTHYVRSIIFGHRAEQLFHFALKQESYSSENSTSLSIGVKDLINLGVSEEGKDTSVSKLSQISHSGLNNKGAPIIIKIDPNADGVKQIYNFMTYEYPKAVTDSKSVGAVLAIEIRPYRDLLLPYLRRVPDWPVTIADYLQGKTVLVQDFVSQVSNLRYARKLSEADYAKLYDGDYKQLPSKLAAAESARVKFKTAVDACEALMRQSALDDAQKKIVACTSGLDAALTKADIDGATIYRKQ